MSWFDIFKPKFLVPIDECGDRIIEVMMADVEWRTTNNWMQLNTFDYLEKKYGIKRKWKNSTMKNYLVFDSEEDYMMFLMKL